MTYKEWFELYGKDYKVKQDEIENKAKEREKAKKKREKEKAKKQQEKEQKQKEKEEKANATTENKEVKESNKNNTSSLSKSNNKNVDGNISTVDKSSENGLSNIESNDIIKNNIGDIDMKAINDYMSSKSYGLNESLRNGYPLDNEQKKLVRDLDIALKKLPTYKGNLTRSVYFDIDEDIKNFMLDYKVGNKIRYKQYTSTTYGDDYNPDAPIQIHILDSKKGRDISDYNIEEKEVLYERNAQFNVENVLKYNGKLLIALKEV